MGTTDDWARLLRLAKSMMDGITQPPPKEQPDGPPSRLFEALNKVLGDEWWKTFPLESMEQAIKALQDSPASALFAGPIAELKATCDLVRAERIAATSVDDPLDDQDVWARVGDKIKEDNDEAKRQGFKGSSPEFGKGYAAGYAAGFRSKGLKTLSVADAGGYPLSLGDQVMKTTGDYTYPGKVVAIFKKTDDETVRVVVESTSEDTRGMLHIFNPSQLNKLWPFRLAKD